MLIPRSTQRHGFTLLELLIASAIGALVMTLAIRAYQQSQNEIRRMEALLRLHRSAGDIAEQWEKDASALLQHVACNVTSTTSGGIKNLVQFTGMRAIAFNYDNLLYDYPHDTDLAWVRWEWQVASHRLTRAQSPPPHWIPWYPDSFFCVFEENSNPMQPIIGMRPNPVRTYAEFTAGLKSWYDIIAPSAPRSTRIYDLLFLTGVDADGTNTYYKGTAAQGFRGEMNPQNGVAVTANNNFNSNRPNPTLWNTASATSTTAQFLSAANWELVPVKDPRRTVAEDVSDCTITLISRAGASQTNASIDGELQDGLASAARLARPELLRLSFTLTDRITGVSQAFTFSAKAP
jgi:prepilin-type N-terminal cleavage/methylation domain-containing protein